MRKYSRLFRGNVKISAVNDNIIIARNTVSIVCINFQRAAALDFKGIVRENNAVIDLVLCAVRENRLCSVNKLYYALLRVIYENCRA